MENQVILYQPNETIKVDVRLDGETVWLTQEQMCALFRRERSVITKHIRNVFAEKELEEKAVCAKFAHTAADGKTYQVVAYNLDVIISVGYRVKSVQGTRFRQWATSILRERILGRNSEARRIASLESRVGAIEVQLAEERPPKEKIFYAGEVFDAYAFLCDRVREAKRRVILIDNYIDDTVLTQLDKRGKNVKATIYTGRMTKKLQLDLNRHNAQYPNIKVVHYPGTHDRFLIVDNALYLIGASVKDAGTKTFSVIKMTMLPEAVLPIQ